MAFVKRPMVSAISAMVLASFGLGTRVSYSEGIVAPFLQSKVPVSPAPTATTPPNMDKWIGTWILNPQKSTYGNDSDQSEKAAKLKQVLKIRVADGTLDLYSRMEMPDGTDVADETHLLDLTGKVHVTEFDGFKPASETFRQIDRNAFEITLKARPTELLDVPDGELAVKVRFTMSADGNTIRETKQYSYREFAAADRRREGANPAAGSVLVFERQQPNFH
jgi:hypothetical protein